MSPLGILAVAGAAGYALAHVMHRGVPGVSKVGAASRSRGRPLAQPQPQPYCCYDYGQPYDPYAQPYYGQEYAQPYYGQEYAQPYYEPAPPPYYGNGPLMGSYGMGSLPTGYPASMPGSFQGSNSQGYEFTSQQGRAF